jgi:antitoxin MazE
VGLSLGPNPQDTRRADQVFQQVLSSIRTAPNSNHANQRTTNDHRAGVARVTGYGPARGSRQIGKPTAQAHPGGKHEDRNADLLGIERLPKARSTDKLWLFWGVGMKVKVQTWGNSLGLRIPKAYATELGVHPGSEMEVNLEAGTLLARPAAAIDLNALLAEITAENQHTECDWGTASGVEPW